MEDRCDLQIALEHMKATFDVGQALAVFVNIVVRFLTLQAVAIPQEFDCPGRG